MYFLAVREKTCRNHGLRECISLIIRDIVTRFHCARVFILRRPALYRILTALNKRIKPRDVSHRCRDGIPRHSLRTWISRIHGIVCASRSTGFLAGGFAVIATAAFSMHPVSTGVPQFVSRVWSIDHGLPANGVHTVLRTKDGYLWIGTEGGLVRFNGREFQAFDAPRFGVLAYQGVTSLAEAADGVIWIGTWGGGLYRSIEGRVERYTVEDGLASNYIKTLFVDTDNAVWVGTRRGLNIIGDSRIASPVHGDDALSHPVMCISGRSDESVLIGTYGCGLIRYSENEFQAYAPVTGFENERITALHVIDPVTVLFGTVDNGAFLMTDSTITPLPLPGDMENAAITAILSDFNGDVWVGAQNNHLVRMVAGRSHGAVKVLDEYPVSPWSLCLDEEYNIWAGTDHSGLIQFHESTINMVSPGTPPGTQRVSAIVQDVAGNMWIGTEESGLYIMRDDGPVHIDDPPEVGDDIVTLLKRFSDETVLVNFLRSGLFRVENGELTRLIDPATLPIRNITDVIRTANDTLILCINGYGLVDVVKDSIFGNRFNGMLSSTFATSVLRTPDGSIWVGTYDQGINRCRGDTVIVIDETCGLSNNSIRFLHGDENGGVWACTYGGGINHIGDDGCTAISVEHGLHSRFVYQMLDDGAGRLWFSSNKGIFSIRKKVLMEFISGRLDAVECRDFGKNDGLSTLECNGAGGYRSAEGLLWFPTTRGAAVVDPADIRHNDVIPPIYIEDIRVNGQYRRFRRYPRSVEQSVYSGQNRFEFQFAALSLAEPEKVRFRYRLRGYDTEWIEAGNDTDAFYTNLPYGDYTFEVTGCNDDRIWNPDGARYSFTVNRRFHETGFFPVICSLGALAIGAGLYSFRVRQLRERQRKLERLVYRRTLDLREANEQLERLANLDGLTGVANRRSFDRLLVVEWKRALRLGEPVSLVFVDIDYFKSYNDTYGHIAGDECLKTVARCLDSNVRRSGDLVARYGGEEFAVLLPNLPEDEAVEFAESLRIHVESQKITHDGSAVCDIVTISIGVATMIPSKTDPPTVLVDRADGALYEAKQRGRNRVASEHDRAGSSPTI